METGLSCIANCCRKCLVALRLTEVLAPRLGDQGLDRLLAEVEIPLIDVLADMEQAGVRVEPTRLKALASEFTARLDQLKAEAHDLAGRAFNLDSPTQLREILFDEFKLPIVKRTKSGPSTDQEVLEELADEHPLCSVLLEHRKLAKLKGTYVDNLPGAHQPRDGADSCVVQPNGGGDRSVSRQRSQPSEHSWFAPKMAAKFGKRLSLATRIMLLALTIRRLSCGCALSGDAIWRAGVRR